MAGPNHLTEHQLWMLRDALARGAVYFAAPDDLVDGLFPKADDPKGHPITPHDTGQKRILRNLVGANLMREDSHGRFVLTERGRELALCADGTTVRRSY